MPTLYTNITLAHPFTNFQFRTKLIHALTEPVLQSRMGPGRFPAIVEDRLKGKHFPYYSTERKRCVVCSRKRVAPNSKAKRDTKTKTWCPKCEQHMCMGRCFELYHTRTYYRKC